MRKYYTYVVKKLVTVQHLVTLEYFELPPGFSYPQESHDFYEFVFVEKGNVFCHAENDAVCLNQEDFYLITPNTPHSYCMQSDTPSTVLIVCFKCKAHILHLLKGRSTLSDDVKRLIRQILFEAKDTFCFPFHKKLVLKSDAKLGSQQLIENYIEEVLIRLIQTETYKDHDIKVVKNALEMKKSIVREVIKTLQDNLYNKITLTDIANTTYYSKTYLNNTFKEMTGTTIMTYFQKMKMEEAKKCLRKGESTIAVAEKLHFESAHYFCKVFKKLAGMTVSEYRNKNE